MTDEQGWQAPAGGPVRGSASASGADGAAAGPDGATPLGAPAGWAPPPKPGLIPLRPLGLGDVLGAAFQVLRRNPRPTFGFALIVSLGANLVVGVVVGVLTVQTFSRIDTASSADADTIAAGSVLALLLAGVVAGILTSAVSAIVVGVVSLEVVRGTLGERHTLGGLWRGLRGRIGALVGWTMLLTGVALGAVLVLAVAVGVVFVVAGPLAGAIVAVLLSGVAQLGGLVLAFWLSTKLAFVPAAIVVERLRIVDAVRRSWAMTRGHFWRIFGIIILTSTVLSLATSVAIMPIATIAPFAALLIDPNGTGDAATVVGVVLAVISLALVSVTTAISLVAQSAVPALLYLDVRMRTEGLDLDLQRYVEDRAAGRPVLENPYLRAPVGGAADGPAGAAG